MRWKLALVAAAVLVLAAGVALVSPPALAQPARGSAADLAAAAGHAGTRAPRAAQPDDVDQERRLSAGPIIGLICAIAASSVALGVAFGLRRRIDRIAGPDPDKADDD